MAASKRRASSATRQGLANTDVASAANQGIMAKTARTSGFGVASQL